MPKFIYLSFPLATDGPRPPAIPAPELTPLYTVADDGAAVQIVKAASHTGTHLDTPRHVIEDGVEITDYLPNELIYAQPVVIDLEMSDCQIVMPEDLAPYIKAMQSADIVLLRFSYGSVRGADPARFCNRCPGFGIEAARYLRQSCPDLRALGMDVPSLACIDKLDETMKAHNILLEGKGCRFIVIEDMKLDTDLTGLSEVRVNPWLVTGMDSAPCSVIGVVENVLQD